MSSQPERLMPHRLMPHRFVLRPRSGTAVLDRPSRRSPRTVVAQLAGRRTLRWGALWGLVFGVYIAESAIAYQAIGATPAARQRLAETWSANHTMAALFGPPLGIDTVGGFTAWRALGFLSLVGAVIGMLLGTSVGRGEEESGRLEILLAGQTTRRGAARQTVLALGAGLAAMLAVTSVVAVLAGRSAAQRVPTSGLLEVSLTAVLTVAVFTAVGVLMGQLAATRRQAVSASAAVFGAAFVVRLLAESAPARRWARWLTPLGWPSLVHAATGFRAAALLVPTAAVVVLAVSALIIAGRRDLGAAVLPDPDTAEPRTALLGGQALLTLRLVRAQALAWLAGLAAMGYLLGLVAQSDSQSMAGSKVVSDALARLGAPHVDAKADLGLSFLIVAVLVAFAGAAAVTATRGEEARGLLDNLLVRPVGRIRWLLCRVAAAAVLTTVCGLAVGATAWAGAAGQHTDIGFGTMLAAGLNTVPPALLLIGIGTLVHAVAPRAVSLTVYAVLGWAFLIEILGSFATINHWILDTSILHHSVPAPAVTPDWATATVLTTLGLLAVATAAAVFARRDLVAQ